MSILDVPIDLEIENRAWLKKSVPAPGAEDAIGNKADRNSEADPTISKGIETPFETERNDGDP